MGLLHIPDAALVDIEKIDAFPPGKVCVISTGSQGEPMSALPLMAAGENRWLELGEDDTVILSSHADPRQRDARHEGHRRAVPPRRRGRALGYRRRPRHRPRQAGGAQDPAVDRQAGVLHPVHGEYRHLVHHAGLAEIMGVPDERIAVCEDGDRSS